MIVRDWIIGHDPQPPAPLRDEIFEALGDDASRDAARAADVCLGTAARALRNLLENARFERADARELLAIDALATYAFEHAAATGDLEALDALAARGIRLFGEATTNV